MVRCVLPLGLVWVAAGGASGHGRSISYSSLELDEAGARIRFRIPLLELTRLPELGASVAHNDTRVGPYLVQHLRVTSGGTSCQPIGTARALTASEGWSVHEWRVACPPGARSVESDVLHAVAPSHLHFARLRNADGGIRERVLSEREPRWLLEEEETAAEPAGTSVVGYIALGFEHIASGADHVAFLLALILLAGSVREVAALVTGFTVAHSVTLGLAALSILRPDTAVVESLIGFSVALVAAENGWLLSRRSAGLPVAVTLGLLGLAGLAVLGVGQLPVLTLLGLALFSACHFALLRRVSRPERLRAGIAFAFGLVHGFGFAGVLGELELPRQRLVPALFGFNVGVELGQLAIVAVAWPLLHWLSTQRQGRVGVALSELGSAAICGVGVFWFVSRAFGG
jgi:hypothetical protein